jgi:hypothetical protein
VASNLRQVRAAFLGDVVTVGFVALVAERLVSCGITPNLGGDAKMTNAKFWRQSTVFMY